MSAPNPNTVAVLIAKNLSGDYEYVTSDNGLLGTTGVLQTGDIEIGAVEIKNDVDDTRAKVGPGSATNALRVTEGRSATVTSTADASVSAKASILAADTTRKSAIVKALRANTANVRIGDNSITVTRGIQLAPGEAVVLDTTAQIYAIAESGTQSVSLLVTQD